MIGPKVLKPSKAEEADAYELATLRDRDTCQRCRRNCGPSARDHRKNRSQAGLTVASNLQVLGLDCHLWKTEHPEAALEQGYAVPSWGDPAEWPARRWIKTDNGTVREGWVLYDDDGTYEEITEAEAMERMQGAGW
jgi:hypothetical protein